LDHFLLQRILWNLPLYTLARSPARDRNSPAGYRQPLAMVYIHDRFSSRQ